MASDKDANKLKLYYLPYGHRSNPYKDDSTDSEAEVDVECCSSSSDEAGPDNSVAQSCDANLVTEETHNVPNDTVTSQSSDTHNEVSCEESVDSDAEVDIENCSCDEKAQPEINICSESNDNIVGAKGITVYNEIQTLETPPKISICGESNDEIVGAKEITVYNEIQTLKDTSDLLHKDIICGVNNNGEIDKGKRKSESREIQQNSGTTISKKRKNKSESSGIKQNSDSNFRIKVKNTAEYNVIQQISKTIVRKRGKSTVKSNEIQQNSESTLMIKGKRKRGKKPKSDEMYFPLSKKLKRCSVILTDCMKSNTMSLKSCDNNAAINCDMYSNKNCDRNDATKSSGMKNNIKTYDKKDNTKGKNKSAVISKKGNKKDTASETNKKDGTKNSDKISTTGTTDSKTSAALSKTGRNKKDTTSETNKKDGTKNFNKATTCTTGTKKTAVKCNKGIIDKDTTKTNTSEPSEEDTPQKLLTPVCVKNTTGINKSPIESKCGINDTDNTKKDSTPNFDKNATATGVTKTPAELRNKGQTYIKVDLSDQPSDEVEVYEMKPDVDIVDTSDVDFIDAIKNERKIYDDVLETKTETSTTTIPVPTYCNLDLYIPDTSDGDYTEAEIESTGNEKKCPMKWCGKVFGRPNRLAQHMRTHTGERPFKCSIEGCSKSYTRQQHLKRHIEAHSKEKDEQPIKITCDLCGKQFTSEYNLRKHNRGYHVHRKFKCDLCGKEFRKQQHLKSHSFIHTGIKPYKCEYPGCGMRFLNPSVLRRHCLIHEGSRYACPQEECSQSFDEYSELRMHLSVAHPKVCDICSRPFKTLRVLKKHRLTHEDVKEAYFCPIVACDKYYYHSSNLKTHIKDKHEQMRIYECGVCSRRLATKQKLINHMEIHEPTYKRSYASKNPRKPRKDKGVSRRDYARYLSGYYSDDEEDERVDGDGERVDEEYERVYKDGDKTMAKDGIERMNELDEDGERMDEKDEEGNRTVDEDGDESEDEHGDKRVDEDNERVNDLSERYSRDGKKNYRDEEEDGSVDEGARRADDLIDGHSRYGRDINIEKVRESHSNTIDENICERMNDLEQGGKEIGSYSKDRTGSEMCGNFGDELSDDFEDDDDDDDSLDNESVNSKRSECSGDSGYVKESRNSEHTGDINEESECTGSNVCVNENSNEKNNCNVEKTKTVTGFDSVEDMEIEMGFEN